MDVSPPDGFREVAGDGDCGAGRVVLRILERGCLQRHVYCVPLRFDARTSVERRDPRSRSHNAALVSRHLTYHRRPYDDVMMIALAGPRGIDADPASHHGARAPSASRGWRVAMRSRPQRCGDSLPTRPPFDFQGIRRRLLARGFVI